MKSVANPRIFQVPFASVHPLYVAKAQRKGRTRKEVDEVICWLTGYDQPGLERQISRGATFQEFLEEAPRMNPARRFITGVICGVRVEEIKDPTMQGIRYIDKLVDELAKGRPMEAILRSKAAAPVKKRA